MTPLPRDYSSVDKEDDERVPFVSVYLKEFEGLHLGAIAGVEAQI